MGYRSVGVFIEPPEKTTAELAELFNGYAR